MDSGPGPCYELGMQDLAKLILIIDDDRDVLKVLQMALDQAGYRTIIAAGTGEAQEMLRVFQFDLVLCDMTMPGENGRDFQKRMAEVYEILPPFIFCSGKAHEYSEKSLEAGVVGYLSKPFSLKTLLDTVEKVFTDDEKIMILRAQGYSPTSLQSP